jgi:hypothetical protein
VHPSTLASRTLLAWVFVSLGRTAETLPIIEDVATSQAARQALGPAHSSTLASRYMLDMLVLR